MVVAVGVLLVVKVVLVVVVLEAMQRQSFLVQERLIFTRLGTVGLLVLLDKADLLEELAELAALLLKPIFNEFQ